MTRTFRDGHTETWPAAGAALGWWGPDSARRLVVASADPDSLPDKTPPPELQHLIDVVTAGLGLCLYPPLIQRTTVNRGRAVVCGQWAKLAAFHYRH